MNEDLLKIILNNKGRFVPLLFTKKQVYVLKKHLGKERLSNAEKKALYTSITKKMQALELLYFENQDIFVNGAQYMLPGRLDAAKQIIEEFAGKKTIIAGSFLFSREYNDIDIYIVAKRGYKEVNDGKRHLIYLTEKKLSDAVFQSSALISVSNFCCAKKATFKKMPLHKVMSVYHEAIIEVEQNDRKKEAVRSLIFLYSLLCEKSLPNPCELRAVAVAATTARLNIVYKTILNKFYSKKYLYVELHSYIKSLDAAIKSTPNNSHLIMYRELYKELLYGRARAKKEAM